jgi:hypothetical protein
MPAETVLTHHMRESTKPQVLDSKSLEASTDICSRVVKNGSVMPDGCTWPWVLDWQLVVGIECESRVYLTSSPPSLVDDREYLSFLGN